MRSPALQAIATTASDLPPEPGGTRASRAIMSTTATARSALLAGIDLLTGTVHALVKERHRSREFIDFLKLLDAAYPTGTPRSS